MPTSRSYKKSAVDYISTVAFDLADSISSKLIWHSAEDVVLEPG